jgi:long-chain acyl-CoA synthetase
MLLSGAAPLSRHVEEFLRVVTCSTLSQGYGKLDKLFCLLVGVWKIDTSIMIIIFQKIVCCNNYFPFFWGHLSIHLYYLFLTGLTESMGGCLTSIGNVYSMVGTVGVPMTTIEVRLESVPEMGYDALSSVPRGEICLRGKTLFSGYHKRQDLTEDVLVDGWFHTGKPWKYYAVTEQGE